MKTYSALVWFTFVVLAFITKVDSHPLGAEQQNPVSINLNFLTPKKETAQQPNATYSTGNQAVCTTPRCLKLAESIKRTLDTNADPCDNFYEYACGMWINRTKIPKQRAQYSTISQLSENNEKILLDSLETSQKTLDTETIMKVKNFYRSCMDVNTIDNLGSQPLLEYIDSLGSWELNKAWNPKKWDFYKVLKHMHKNYPSEVLFTVDVISDPVKKKEDRKYIPMVCYLFLKCSSTSIYLCSKKLFSLYWFTGIISQARSWENTKPKASLVYKC